MAMGRVSDAARYLLLIDNLELFMNIFVLVFPLFYEQFKFGVCFLSLEVYCLLSGLWLIFSKHLFG